MKMLHISLPIIAVMFAGSVLAADAAEGVDQAGKAVDPGVVRAFRIVQLGLTRIRSDKPEDADLVVCVRQTPVGSHQPLISCATNAFWGKIRDASLSAEQGGTMGYASGGSAHKADKVFSMSANDFNYYQKHLGPLPDELKDKH